MLNQEMIEDISGKNIVFATADKNGQPRCVWVVPSRVEEKQIIISAIQMNRTFNNLKDNSKCFLNVFIPEKEDLQYKIEGLTKVYKSGKLFNEIKHYEETENLPEDLKVFAIIVVEIKNVEVFNG